MHTLIALGIVYENSSIQARQYQCATFPQTLLGTFSLLVPSLSARRDAPTHSSQPNRWLNNAQAAADSANFMTNVKFGGIEDDLTAPSTPWIYYGGSYAGARAAHMK